MRHLDDRVSDLIDDRLDHHERDRALAHLAVCRYCREAVDMERYAKGALTSLPDIEVPPALMNKLMALAEPGGPLPPENSSAGRTADVAPWGSAPGSYLAATATAQQTRPSFVDRHRRAVRVAAGGMVSTGAMLVMLASLGAPSGLGRDETPETVVPPLTEFTVEHARSTGGLPFAEPASIMVPALSSWAGDTSDTVPTPNAGSTGFGQGTVADRFGFANSTSARDGR